MNRLVFLSALLFACSGGSGDTTSTGTNTGTTTGATGTGATNTGSSITTVPTITGSTATVDLGGECPLADRYGGFEIAIFELFSTVSGSVADGVVPITVHEQVGADATCRLMRRNLTFCDPACQPDETCDFDGNCIPFPLNQDIGTVTIGGLEQDLILNPIQPGNTYFETSLPHPVFLPDQLVELQTHNSTVFDDVTLHGIGVEELTSDDENLVLSDESDLLLTWNPPVNGSARSNIHVRVNIDQHGSTPTQLFCEFPDTGSGAVPASLIAQLMSFGVTGFPNATVTRRTVDSTTVGAGCVEMIVKSQFEPSVAVEGFIPCNTDQDCPDGLACTPPPVGLCE